MNCCDFHLLQAELQAIVGDRMTTVASALEQHGKDESFHRPMPPQACGRLRGDITHSFQGLAGPTTVSNTAASGCSALQQEDHEHELLFQLPPPAGGALPRIQ